MSVPLNELASLLKRRSGQRASQWYFGSKRPGGYRSGRFCGIETTKPGKSQIAERLRSIWKELGESFHPTAGDVDVASLKHMLWIAALSYTDHGTAQELRGGDVLRKQRSEDRHKRLCHGIEDAVAAGS